MPHCPRQEQNAAAAQRTPRCNHDCAVSSFCLFQPQQVYEVFSFSLLPRKDALHPLWQVYTSRKTYPKCKTQISSSPVLTLGTTNPAMKAQTLGTIQAILLLSSVPRHNLKAAQGCRKAQQKEETSQTYALLSAEQPKSSQVKTG